MLLVGCCCLQLEEVTNVTYVDAGRGRLTPRGVSTVLCGDSVRVVLPEPVKPAPVAEHTAQCSGGQAGAEGG